MRASMRTYEKYLMVSKHKKKIWVKGIMDQTTIILLMMAMFVCVVLIAGGGYYYTTTLEEVEEDTQEKKTGVCMPSGAADANAVYEYNNEGECDFKECKEGFFQQGGWCITPYDASATDGVGLSNGPPIDCEVRSYTWGQCISDTTGLPMTGVDIDSCGSGTKKGVAADYDIARNGGSCEDFEKTESCFVACPKSCPTDQKYYTASSSCMSGGKELSVDGEFCGTGTRLMTLDRNKIPDDELNGLSRDEYFNQNWADCPSITGVCEIPCKAGQTKETCPDPDETAQMSYVVDGRNKPICFKEEFVTKFMNGEVPFSYDDENRVQSISAKDLWNGSEYDDSLRPKGYKLKFRAGGTSFADQVAHNCAAIVSEPCGGPVIDKDCEYEPKAHVISECGLVEGAVCGPFKMSVKDKVTRPAYGDGNCGASQNEIEKSCVIGGIQSKDCCSSDVVGGWKKVEGYDGCVQDPNDGNKWKRKFTRTGHPSCSDSNTELRDNGDCNYDCEASYTYGVRYYEGNKTNIRDIVNSIPCGAVDLTHTQSVTRNPKGGGKACKDLDHYKDLPADIKSRVRSNMINWEGANACKTDAQCIASLDAGFSVEGCSGDAWGGSYGLDSGW